MSNAYSTLMGLLPQRPLQLGEVESAIGDVCVVALVEGGKVTARGSASVGQRVFVRDSVIEATAPTLDIVNIDV